MTRVSASPRPRAHRHRREVAVLVGADVSAFCVAAVATGSDVYSALQTAVVLGCLMAASGLYRQRTSPSVFDDAGPVLGRALVTASLVLLARAALGEPPSAGVLLLCLLFAGTCLFLRGIVHSSLRAARRHGLYRTRTLVVGGGSVARDLTGILLDHPEHGLEPVGVLDDGDPDGGFPIRRLGTVDQLARTIDAHAVEAVVVAFGQYRSREVVDVLRTCDRLRTEIYFVPRLFELQSISRDMEEVWGVPLVRLRRAAFRTPSWRLKRVLDVVASAVALLLFAPVLATCAALVRREVGTPVIFRQQRVGLDGRHFEILKLRTIGGHDQAGSQSRWTVDDGDVGPVGRFLRRSSLDELPQLWNVLRGDMSLVGPRPERPLFVDQFTEQFPRYVARHRVPAGLTGLAQVNGLRGDTSIADRVRFDNWYVENWSLWLDLVILLRTLSQVFRGAGR